VPKTLSKLALSSRKPREEITLMEKKQKRRKGSTETTTTIEMNFWKKLQKWKNLSATSTFTPLSSRPSDLECLAREMKTETTNFSTRACCSHQSVNRSWYHHPKC
jgi:hypothetical protein